MTIDYEPALLSTAPRFIRLERVLGGQNGRKRLLSVAVDAIAAYDQADEEGHARVYLVGQERPFIVAQSYAAVAALIEGE